jgi:hypothetical protein
VSLNDFLKSCVKRPDGKLLCWDYDTSQYVVVDIKKEVVSLSDLTEAEIVALKKRVDLDNKTINQESS